jgi:2-polyprenyl-3-methyl-5-hydroxy-6-metoxy-1,4-benzoquinol methylase
MDLYSKEQQEKFEKVWDPEGEGRYRLGSPGHRLVKVFTEYAPAGCVVNDYGAGTGRAAVALARAGYRVNMVDIATNALEEEALEFVKKGMLTWTHASLWELPMRFPKADWGFCIDVLMTLPPERATQALSEIRRTCSNLFVQVDNWSDPRLGMEMHPVRMDAEHWQAGLLVYWPEVTRIASVEDSRRYIFVCRRG